MPNDPEPDVPSGDDESSVAAVTLPDVDGHTAENIEERGEPFDGNVA